jgi:hypothetical protein
MKKQAPKKELIFAPNLNMFCEDNNNTIFIEINQIESCYIDNKTNYSIQITADNKQISLTFDAKELLSCLNKNTINELKENLKQQIDNL